jgi:hypothetical protein
MIALTLWAVSIREGAIQDQDIKNAPGRAVKKPKARQVR